MTNLSQWFLLSEQTPWEVGVYEVQVSHLKKADGMLSFFDGRIFRYIKNDVDSAFNAREEYTSAQVTHWRGLSTNPEVKKKPRNQRKQFVIVMKAAGENLELRHPVGVFEDEKNADAFLEIHQKRCPKFYYYKSWTPRFRTPE